MRGSAEYVCEGELLLESVELDDAVAGGDHERL
jgi:hypothetical protein